MIQCLGGKEMKISKRADEFTKKEQWSPIRTYCPCSLKYSHISAMWYIKKSKLSNSTKRNNQD